MGHTPRKISDFDLISFDVFDTLIERSVHSPKMAFAIVEKKMRDRCGFSIPGFTKMRHRAERQAHEAARKQGCEAGLADIYRLLQKRLALTDDQMAKVMDLEIAVETRLLHPRLPGMDLFEEAKTLRKKIVLASDMYLPRQVIVSILKKNGITGYDDLMISCEEGAAKRDGRMFDLLLKRHQVTAKDVLHIGDNPRTDIEQAERKGIATIHLQSATDCRKRETMFNYVFQGALESHPTISSSYLSKMVVEQLSAIDAPEGFFADDPQNFGYCALGPLMLGLSRWLRRQVVARGVDRLLFLSRDGKVMKACYEELYGTSGDDSGLETRYTLSSRQNARFCSLTTHHEISMVLATQAHSQTVLRYLTQQFGLHEGDIDHAVLKAVGTAIDARVERDSSPDFLRAIVMPHADTIMERSRQRREAYANYLRAEIGDARCPAIVDIGYSGTNQAFMEDLLGREVTGLYLYTNAVPDYSGISPDRFCGYLDDMARKKKSRGIETHRWMYETLICSTEASLGDFLLPPPPPAASPYQVAFVDAVHRGALEFCQDAKERLPCDLGYLWFTPEDATVVLDTFLKYPHPSDLRMFLDLRFEDNMGSDVDRFVLADEGPCIWSQGAKTLHQPSWLVVCRDRTLIGTRLQGNKLKSRWKKWRKGR